MPGIDGLELQRNLASANRRVPIIFVSAHANDDERTEAINGGAVDFLRKPFSEEALFNANLMHGEGIEPPTYWV